MPCPTEILCTIRPAVFLVKIQDLGRCSKGPSKDRRLCRKSHADGVREIAFACPGFSCKRNKGARRDEVWNEPVNGRIGASE